MHSRVLVALMGHPASSHLSALGHALQAALLAACAALPGCGRAEAECESRRHFFKDTEVLPDLSLSVGKFTERVSYPQQLAIDWGESADVSWDNYDFPEPPLRGPDVLFVEVEHTTPYGHGYDWDSDFGECFELPVSAQVHVKLRTQSGLLDESFDATSQPYPGSTISFGLPEVQGTLRNYEASLTLGAGESTWITGLLSFNAAGRFSSATVFIGVAGQQSLGGIALFSGGCDDEPTYGEEPKVDADAGVETWTRCPARLPLCHEGTWDLASENQAVAACARFESCLVCSYPITYNGDSRWAAFQGPCRCPDGDVR